ncbi:MULTISPECIES: MlaD family protein [unclassified Nocardioides]|uniref:MlaD family protein n=1 Tax=unclassified Nocardioides TaxID=2615069 RepID=UPI0007033014|nr:MULTISPECIES: MlaD family protein [unclassified Nocardioides]KRC54167.1 virulence factor Mce [Nocardioides sp. Root79]KRC71503.1 virulence factor Mce [Nocardioides sp. Root240]
MSDTDQIGLEPRSRMLIVVAFAAFCGLIFGFLWTHSGGKLPVVASTGYTVQVDVPRVGNLVYFSDVMVAGVKVGKVAEVSEQGDHARVVLELDDAVVPLHEGATVQVGAKSLVEESFVEVTDGTGAELESGAVLAAGAGKGPVQLDDVLKTLDAPTRKSVRAVLRSLGSVGDGNEKAVADAIRGLGDLGRNGTTVLDALAAQGQDIKGLTRNAARVLAALSERRTQLSALVDDASTVVAATAGQADDVREVMRALPPLMTTARDSSDDLTRLSTALAPVARNLTAAAPDLTRALRQLPATSRDLRATLPALSHVLDRAPATLDRVPGLADDVDGLIRPAEDVLADLNPMLGYLAPYDRDLAAWFTNFAQTIGLGDVNGKAFRVMPVLNEQSFTGWPFSTNIGPLDRYNPMPAPGSLDSPGPYGSAKYPRIGRE